MTHNRVNADSTERPRINGHISFWMDQLAPFTRRAPLDDDIDVDVAIVGAGYTGLWTAYYLLKQDPSLSIAILEKEIAGYGASGRNGGWLSAEPPGDMSRYAASRGVEATRALQEEMFRTVDEVVSTAGELGIDASIHKDGLLYFASNPAQMKRLEGRAENSKKWGWGDDDYALLSGDQVRERVNVRSATGGFFTPHGARVNPAELVRGLAKAVEGLGATIYEDTLVSDFESGRVSTDRGVVTARSVLVTLEGYLSKMPGYGRRMLPMNSSMVITDPLPDDVWESIGWHNSETLGDSGHGFTYMQRTDDHRIALGGRGVPYDFGSSFDWDGHTKERAIGQLVHRLHDLFPETRGVSLAHTWTGVLGVPRDWSGTVNFDSDSRLGIAGGFVGHGVAGTNLAGRTLADLVLEKNSDLTKLGWMSRSPRKWEPEPVRWFGASALYRVYSVADQLEQRSSSPDTSVIAKIADTAAGR